MARHYYVGANGAEPPLTELEREKLKGQQLANEITQTKLAALRGSLLDRREVKFVVETMAIALRQELMRLPSAAVRSLRGSNLSHEVLFSVRTSVEQGVRSALDKASDTLGRALSPRAFISEFAGEEQQPSQKDIDTAERRKARANAKRRERRASKR
jgi:uncharacterized protein YigA (DUF484 family)